MLRCRGAAAIKYALGTMQPGSGGLIEPRGTGVGVGVGMGYGVGVGVDPHDSKRLPSSCAVSAENTHREPSGSTTSTARNGAAANIPAIAPAIVIDRASCIAV